MAAVLCEVSNCAYNVEGKRCNATEIFVVSQKGKEASSLEETDCKTFTTEI